MSLQPLDLVALQTADGARPAAASGRGFAGHDRQQRIEESEHEYHRVRPSRGLFDELRELRKHDRQWGWFSTSATAARALAPVPLDGFPALILWAARACDIHLLPVSQDANTD